MVVPTVGRNRLLKLRKMGRRLNCGSLRIARPLALLFYIRSGRKRKLSLRYWKRRLSPQELIQIARLVNRRNPLRYRWKVYVVLYWNRPSGILVLVKTIIIPSRGVYRRKRTRRRLIKLLNILRRTLRITCHKRYRLPRLILL